MKMKLRPLTAALSAAIITVSAGAFTAFADSGDVEINNTNFPDENFRTYVSGNFDKDKNGSLSQSEIDAVNYIKVNSKKIADMSGIEYFTALTSLYCDGNQLTSLDISRNTLLTILDCSSNKLESLDVSKNTALTYLWCDTNSLESLDVSSCTAIKKLDCYSNKLTSLNVSGNTALEELSCHKNLLESLDLGSCTSLKILRCYVNQLTSLDISNNTALEVLSCEQNPITSLDVSSCIALKELSCGDNRQLSDLNISKNNALTRLSCGNSKLTKLDVSQMNDLKYLDCHTNQLTSLDVSKNTALTTLNCDTNQLTKLDVSKNTILEQLLCSGNQLTNLDVSKNTVLERLDCAANQLTSLDVSKNTSLKALKCSFNQLANLDVSQNTALKRLVCSENQLTSIDISKNSSITFVNCEKNQLTTLDASKNTVLEQLICSENQLTNLDLGKNTVLNNLDCDDNQLTTLDVTQNTALRYFSCLSNQLTSLDLSKNKYLNSTIYTSYNVYYIGEVTSYDLSNLPGSFDITRTSDWQGATLVDSILTNFTSKSIKYVYDCGNGRKAKFTLMAASKPNDPDNNSDPVSAFVDRLYNIILDRPAEEGGLADWTNALISGTKTSADIVYGLANSPEFNNKGLSNDQIVERMYLAMLGRPSDAGGKADWIDAMANGCTVNGIINGFSGSQEFAGVCAGYGIKAGNITSCEPRDKNVNLTAFVSRMYTKALGRAYDVYGLNDWTNDYLNGAATANKIAYGFILSDEFAARGLSNDAYVDTLYRTFFDREPDASGKANWLNEMRRGASRKDVLDGFLGAQEFANLKASFGV